MKKKPPRSRIVFLVEVEEARGWMAIGNVCRSKVEAETAARAEERSLKMKARPMKYLPEE